MMRVKNEARWIEKAVRSIIPVCDSIHVLNDNSDDGTGELCREMGCHVYDSPFDTLDEARDKDWLLDRIQEHAGGRGWVVCIDGDEALKDSHRDRLVALTKKPQAPAYTVRILYLWDREDQFRTDGVYSRFYRPSIFRLKPGLSFLRTGRMNFHCSSVPAEYLRASKPSGIEFLHYGYMLREDRIRKFRWYNERDPENQLEDGYRHMVI